MNEELELALEVAQEMMEKALLHLQRELTKVRAGKASPLMLQGLMVDYYGAPTPLQQVANVTTLDARTLIIQPWEKSVIAGIEKAIFNANLGVTPMNDGEAIRLTIPMLTEERRRDLVKQVKALAEDAKVSIRSGRREAMEAIKKAQKDGLSEDAAKSNELQFQGKTDKYITQTDAVAAEKEKEIMTV